MTSRGRRSRRINVKAVRRKRPSCSLRKAGRDRCETRRGGVTLSLIAMLTVASKRIKPMHISFRAGRPRKRNFGGRRAFEVSEEAAFPPGAPAARVSPRRAAPFVQARF
jgi:hypothetical protein